MVVTARNPDFNSLPTATTTSVVEPMADENRNGNSKVGRIELLQGSLINFISTFTLALTISVCLNSA